MKTHLNITLRKRATSPKQQVVLQIFIQKQVCDLIYLGNMTAGMKNETDEVIKIQKNYKKSCPLILNIYKYHLKSYTNYSSEIWLLNQNKSQELEVA
jgi:hypothetical protein